MNIPQLGTARLRLRAFQQRDLDAYAAICADPEVMRHIGTGGPVGRDVAWRQMALFLGAWALHGHGMWALQRISDGRLIGRVGFLQPEGWPGCELAWTLARDAWGHGYATEAGAAALHHAFEVLAHAEVIATIFPENVRSVRVAEKLGLRFTGARRHPGAGRDIAVYRIDRVPPRC